MSALVCLSHTPVMPFIHPAPEVESAVHAGIDSLHAYVKRFDPEVVFVFAPDHYNGFFYDLMPPFCIGMQAEAIGDYGTLAGPIRIDRELAEACARHVLARGIDLPVSYRMRVDHGFAQPLEKICGGLGNYAVVPVFVNCVAPPLGPIERIRKLGHAVGEFAALLNKRVLFIGSGGLSHNPPIPKLASASPEVAARLIDGRNPSPQSRQEREARVIGAARDFAAGTSPLARLNPEWDQAVLDLLAAADWERIDAFDTDWISREGGESAQEIRTWIGAFAALGASGRYRIGQRFYKAIPEWIAGFGMMQAESE
jgi:2,3-dihydroxyphenylpropionate 1,2-dioxygenase